jgi:hypothetical protein
MSNQKARKVLSSHDGLAFSHLSHDCCVFWLFLHETILGVTDEGFWAIERDGMGRNGTCLVFNGSEFVPNVKNTR